MKYNTLILILTLTWISTHSFAQTTLSLNEPTMAPRIRFNESQFIALYTKPVNSNIQIASPFDNIQLQGTVISNEYNADTQTRFVVINLSNFQTGTVLTLKSVVESGNTNYKATITNPDSGEAYQLSAIFDGKVVLSKFKAGQITVLQP